MSEDIRSEKKMERISEFVMEQHGKGRKLHFFMKAIEFVIAFAIIAIALAAAVPTSHSLLADLGVASPIIPIMAMFSNFAINRRSLHFFPIMMLLAYCTIMYCFAVIGIIIGWETIQINQSKYRLFQIVNFYLIIIMIVILFCDALILVYRKVTGKFITNYRSDSI
ncbi:hypothetical protein GE061_012262 [Apolygus lucorum]|uniref:Uncharacterized protein n=1 Tax=Apolygus lucorum TaxID=248454 RepID=A0A6A4JN52_APOLU|nr:hypothetical protein GE061_012262 [Apolygus lucorum]